MMNKDGFSYPINEYWSTYRCKCYVYQCNLCGAEIFPYFQKRVRGKITCAKCRTVFGSTSYNKPSRFLSEIPENLVDGTIKKKEEEYFDFDGRGERYSTFDIKEPVAAFSYRTADSFLKKAVGDDTVDLNAFGVGVKVMHKKFGEGVITNAEPEEDDLKLDINFDKVGSKRLMAKFAKLEIL